MTHNDMYEWNSTIDTWMIDAFYPSLRKASTSKEWEKIKGKMMGNVVSYRYMARLVASEAKKLGLLLTSALQLSLLTTRLEIP
jgi:hypothetical protein